MKDKNKIKDEEAYKKGKEKSIEELRKNSAEELVKEIKRETAMTPTGAAVFILDSSAMTEMINQTSIGKELLEKIKTVKDSGARFFCMTTQSSFYNAIYKANSDANIQAIQKLLYVCEIMEDDANFMKDEEVTESILFFVKMLNERGRPMRF